MLLGMLIIAILFFKVLGCIYIIFGFLYFVGYEVGVFFNFFCGSFSFSIGYFWRKGVLGLAWAFLGIYYLLGFEFGLSLEFWGCRDDFFYCVDGEIGFF